MCKKCKAKMNGRRRKKRSSVGAFSLKDSSGIVSAVKGGLGLLGGQFIASKIGKVLAEKVPIKKDDGTTIMQPGEVSNLIAGVIQIAGGIAVAKMLPEEKYISGGMISGGVVSIAKNFLPQLDKWTSLNGNPWGSTYNPGVAGPNGSLYLPGVAGPGSVMIE